MAIAIGKIDGKDIALDPGKKCFGGFLKKVSQEVRQTGEVTSKQVINGMNEILQDEKKAPGFLKAVDETLVWTKAQIGAFKKLVSVKAQEIADAIGDAAGLVPVVEKEVSPSDKERTIKIAIPSKYELNFAAFKKGKLQIEREAGKNIVKVTTPPNYDKNISFDLDAKVGGKDKKVRVAIKLGTKEAGAAGDNAAQETKSDSFSAKPVKKDESTSEFTLPDGAKIEDGLNKDGKTADGKFQIETSDGGKKFKLKATEDVKENTNAEVKYKDAQGAVQTAKVAFKTSDTTTSTETQSGWQKWGIAALAGGLGFLVWLGTTIATEGEKRFLSILGGLAAFVGGLAACAKADWIRNLLGGSASSS